MRDQIFECLRFRLIEGLKRSDQGETVIIADDEMEAQYAESESVIKHVDLWNRNVEFIEEEEPWERPAVFVEFEPIVWEPLKMGGGRTYRTRSRFRLHVVTDWTGGDDLDSVFDTYDLLDKIRECLYGMSSTRFDDVELVESHTNHDHGELVDNIEIYSYRGMR